MWKILVKRYIEEEEEILKSSTALVCNQKNSNEQNTFSHVELYAIICYDAHKSRIDILSL